MMIRNVQLKRVPDNSDSIALLTPECRQLVKNAPNLGCSKVNSVSHVKMETKDIRLYLFIFFSVF